MYIKNYCKIESLIVDDPNVPPADVAITVTEPSPEQPPITPVARLSENQGNLVHVLVHRESEEYQTDVEDGNETTIMRVHGKSIFS